ncbi:MAG: type II secretion protein ATPase [Gammaproteobacteria bacterium]|nr:MAG: type II secretion protein ATPase [Gammaproteobacteria bacterium]
MAGNTQYIDKSRLGRLLINRGYIDESQLAEALQRQKGTEKRLGEVLIELGYLTEKALARTLKHQSRYRYAAAFVAMVATPLQPLVAFGATATQAIPVSPTSALKVGGMRALTEDDMAEVSAQGDVFGAWGDLTGQVAQAREEAREKLAKGEEPEALDGVKTVTALGQMMFPLSHVLEADTKIEGVTWDPARAKPLFNEDGSMNVNLPTRIEHMYFDNIRVAGSTGPTMGSIRLEGIEFHDNASIVIRPLR